MRFESKLGFFNFQRIYLFFANVLLFYFLLCATYRRKRASIMPKRIKFA